jgi:hypothetical protein
VQVGRLLSRQKKWPNQQNQCGEKPEHAEKYAKPADKKARENMPGLKKRGPCLKKGKARA